MKSLYLRRAQRGIGRPNTRVISAEILESRVLLAAEVLTFHNDIASTGVNAEETALTPANVRLNSFGKLYEMTLDGQVYTQPLIDVAVNIVPGVNTMPGVSGLYDVALVATQHGSLYALDAQSNTGRILWKRSFIDTANVGGNINNTLGATSITTVSTADTGATEISPEISITGTPVIDPDAEVAFLVVKTKEVVSGVTQIVQRLHAIRMRDGTNYVSPYLIGTTTGANTNNTPIYVFGTGDGAVIDPYQGTGRQVVQFNALRQNSRLGLSLVNDQIYVGWASHSGNGPYHGWAVSWDVSQIETTGMRLSGVLNTSPNDGLAGIWHGGGRFAFEPDGSAFYFQTGNGIGGAPVVDAQGFPVDGNYNEAVVKVVADPTTSATNQHVNGWGLRVADYFIPHNVVALDQADTDLGSSGPVVLPASAGIPGHPKLMVAAGKEGKIYLLDRDNLGKFDPQHDRVLNSVPNGSGNNTPPVTLNGALSTAAFFNDRLYWLSGFNGSLNAYEINDNGTLTRTSQSALASHGFLPGSVSVSANGTQSGIVWAMDRQAQALRAYDANTLATELWNSKQKAFDSDAVGGVVKFATPTIALGRAFVGNLNGIAVLGLTPPTNQAPLAPVLSATAVSSTAINLNWTDPTQSPNLAGGYRIERSTNNVNFTPVTTAAAGATSVSVGGLSPQTTYYFRIRGYNGVGDSPYSNTALATTSSQQSSLDYSGGFAAAGSSLTYNGSAALVGNRARLTSGGANQAGSFYATSRVSVSQFATQFDFQTTAGVSAGEGFTLVWQNAGVTAVGRSGAGLGYGPEFSGGPGGIGSSVALKFDLGNNAGEGNESIGVYTNGAVPTTLNSVSVPTTSVNLHSGRVLRVNVTYSGTTLTVVLSDPATGGTFSRSFTVNIPQIVGGNTAFVGFTGGTGTLTATQEIVSWTYVLDVNTAPNAPTGLGAAVTGPTSIELNWTNQAVNQSGYRLDRARDADFTQGLVTQTLPASPARYVDTTGGLAPGNTYYYRLRAYNAAGDSTNSNVASVTIPVAPPRPTNQAITHVTTTRIDMRWQDNAGTLAEGYHILRAANRGPFLLVATLPPTTRPVPSTYEWSDTGLTPGVYYDYHIHSFNISGTNDFAGVNATTVPSPPTNLAAARSGSVVNLSWSAAAGAASYRVYRGTVSGQETLLVSGVTATSYQDTTAQAGATYYYRVTGVNLNAGFTPPLPSESGPSNEVSISIGTQAPINLRATPVSSSRIDLSWQAPVGVTGYDVFVWTGSGYSKVASLSASATSYSHTNLQPVTYYNYAVRAKYANGSTGDANTSAVTLSSATAVTNLRATAVSGSRVDLSWQAAAGAVGFDVFQWNGAGYTQITSLGATATSYSRTGLAPLTYYNFAVRAKYANGDYADRTVGVVTPEGFAPPRNLTATSVNSSQIQLNWEAPAGVTGFEVFFWDDYQQRFRSLGELAASTTSYNVIYLSPSTFYNFAVRAKYAGGDYADSFVATLTRSQFPPPVGLQATAVSSSQVDLSWQSAAGVTGFDVFQWQGDRYVLITSLSATATGYSRTGLLANTFYNFAVRAKYASGYADGTTFAMTLG